jgi:hypothetical protein
MLLLLGTGLCAGGRPGFFGLGVLAAEALDASCGIDQFLFARKKWVTIGADFHVDVAFMSGACDETISAGAHDADLVICRMNIGLH